MFPFSLSISTYVTVQHKITYMRHITCESVLCHRLAGKSCVIIGGIITEAFS